MLLFYAGKIEIVVLTVMRGSLFEDRVDQRGLELHLASERLKFGPFELRGGLMPGRVYVIDEVWS